MSAPNAGFGAAGGSTVYEGLLHAEHRSLDGLPESVGHERVLTEGGDLRLVIPAQGVFPHVWSLTGIDRLVSCFNRLEEALLPDSASQRR